MREITQRVGDLGVVAAAEREIRSMPVRHGGCLARWMSSAVSESVVAERALLGDSTPMKTVRALLSAVVDAEAPVVLSGERGVGKMRIARWLHDSGLRAAGPLVVVQCPALPVVGVEEHLLGPGNGAVARAAGGTLVLDGVDALPARVQVSLLRALAGLDALPSTTRPRIVSTLLDAPAVAIRAGRLREDLRFRLGVFTIAVPPLRERRDDLLFIADDIIRQSCTRRGRRTLTLTVSAREQLLAHHWPGNLSELEACVEHAIDDHDDDDNDRRDDEGLDLQVAIDATSLFAVEVTSLAAAPTLETVELRYIHHILRLVGGNKTRAAEVLQVDRRTLYRRLARKR